MKEQLLELCQRFINENQIGHAECIHQCDGIQMASPHFIEEVCDLIGYYDPEEGEE